MKKIFKSIGRYFKGVKKEIGRIRWTSLKDLVKYSVTAVLFMLFLGLYFYAIDWIITLVRSAV
ncbi:MAG: preprotein translocase subunit SecE [Bacilli bacterium]|nr:preprotein translocase subunit SecE [Bacilli bacterium]